jgi:tetratricopeptide (TPR) repeat protein
MNKYNEAIEYLKKFDLDDKLLSCVALGSIGDCYSELNQNDEAVKYYERAADHVKNDFSSPIYLMRAGLLLEETGSYKKALDIYQRIEKEFNKTNEGQQISKYITRVKVKGNF